MTCTLGQTGTPGRPASVLLRAGQGAALHDSIISHAASTSAKSFALATAAQAFADYEPSGESADDGDADTNG